MADEGLFRLLVPRSLGGVELDFPGYLRIVETFARADGSTAWCVNQNNVFATDAVRMPVETAQEIWADPRAVISNGPPMPPACAILCTVAIASPDAGTSAAEYTTPTGSRLSPRWAGRVRMDRRARRVSGKSCC